jgi:glucose-6-phosphate isomerase
MVSEGDTVHAGQLLMTLESGVSDLDVSEAQAQLRARKMPEADVARIAPHRVFSGNRPSVTIIYDKLTPFALGRLIALYEHRVFVEAQLFGINAFDQWGVELGKELATELLDVVSGKQSADGRDASTQGLIAHLRQSL